jgi:DNA-binding ferritin-like protein
MNERHQRDLAVRLPEPVGLLESRAVRLSRHLADSIYLYARAKRSVKGQQSVALDELFERVAEAVEEAVAELIKRAVALGRTADDALHSVAGRTRRAVHPADSTAGTEHVGRLAAALATYARNDRTPPPARTTRPT